MKKWTCSILAGLLITVSTLWSAFGQRFSELCDAVDAFSGWPRKMLSGWLGIDLVSVSEPVWDEITVTVTHEPEASPSTSAAPEKAKILPTVLIYHTHTDEAYEKGMQNYQETSPGRTLDDAFNVVAVGEALKHRLEELGFTVIHDVTDNVSEDFNHAYEKSYKTILPYVGTAEVFIDLHRDAYEGEEPNYEEKDSTQYARMCFVVANGTSYEPPARWQTNQPLAEELTRRMNSRVPGIAGRVLFRSTRFNQHVSDACLLLEVGNEKNTLSQAVNAAILAAEVLADYYTEAYIPS